MANIFGKAAAGGDLAATLIPAPKIHKAREFFFPWGRIAVTRDKGNGKIWGYGDAPLFSNLSAIHRDGDGKLINIYDLGSGSTTSIGCNELVNDVLGWAIGPALKNFNFHGCGTGTTASATTDAWLQTAIASGSLTGSTNGYFTGAQSVVAGPIYKTVATTVYNATLAVTEWVLTMSNLANTFLTATATGTNSATFASGVPTAGNGVMGFVVQGNGTPPINTPTSTVISTPCTTNSSTVITFGASGTAGGWTTLANGTPSGTGPGAVALSIIPATLDHKVFAAINVNAADSIQWVYQLTLTPQV